MIDISKNYQRLFKASGLRYLINDIWTDHYKTMEALVVVIDDEYTSFLPAIIIEHTLIEGKQIHITPRFKEYQENFMKYIKEFSEFFDELKKKKILTRDDVKQFTDYAAGFFPYYSKTEFFYTDHAYLEAQNLQDQTINTQLKELGELKNLGREKLNGIFFGLGSALSHLLNTLAHQFKIGKVDLEHYSRSELLNLFEGVTVPESILNDRKIAIVMIGKGKEDQHITVGEKAREYIQKFFATQEEKNKVGQEIKGIIAHKGKVTGKAIVIRADYHNFDELIKKVDIMDVGDVLVAETTSPELIQACQKASAIVTDQGGLLSHAAIVSRELNIPCIVATHNATKLIKDGDMVEVDAERGIVRIL